MTTRFSELLATSRRGGVGVGAFNVVLLEHAEAIVAGAEAAGRPTILQISENCIDYHGSIEPIVLASQAIAHAARVPVLVHLDHLTSVELVARGVELGVDSVMFDGSKLSYEENVQATLEMARLCHGAGIAIEAELGEIGGKNGVHAPGVRTDPHDAQVFAAATEVDALAVAVGTSHAMDSRTAQVDLALVREIRAAVSVPLVLHGSSGLDDDQLRTAVQSGMTKINISTHLNGLFTRAVRDYLAEESGVSDPRRYVAEGRIAISGEVERLLALFA